MYRDSLSHPQAQRAALCSAVSTCRSLASQHPKLGSLADSLHEIEQRIAGVRGTAPDLAAAARALENITEPATQQTRDELAPVAGLLRRLLDEKALLDAAVCVEVPRGRSEP